MPYSGRPEDRAHANYNAWQQYVNNGTALPDWYDPNLKFDWKNPYADARQTPNVPNNFSLEQAGAIRNQQIANQGNVWNGVDPFNAALGDNRPAPTSPLQGGPLPTKPATPITGGQPTSPLRGGPLSAGGSSTGTQPAAPLPAKPTFYGTQPAAPLPAKTNPLVSGSAVNYDNPYNSPDTQTPNLYNIGNGLPQKPGSSNTPPMGVATAVSQNPLSSGGAVNTGTPPRINPQPYQTTQTTPAVTAPGSNQSANTTAGGSTGQSNRRVGVNANGHLTLDGQDVVPYTQNQVTGQLNYDSRFYGTAGPVTEGLDIDNSADRDPRYWMRVQTPGDDSGAFTWQLRPDVARRLNGRVQIGQRGVGGPGEVIDPNLVDYDEEFGLVTHPSNIRTPQNSGLSGFLSDNLVPILLAAGGLGVASHAGLFSGGAAAGAGAGTIPQVAIPELLANVAPVTIPEMIAAPTIGGGMFAGLPSMGTVGSALRTAASAVSVANAASRLTGGNGIFPTSGGGSGTSSGSAGGGGVGSSLGEILSTVGSNVAANRNINQFENFIRQMIERGDPYGPERAAAIARLRQLEANPGSVTDNPLFRDMNTKSQDDLARRLAARGYTNSGNESGALQENFLANMNKFYGDEWNRIAREAGVFIDPSTAISGGMRAAGEVYGARTNRDAGLAAALNRMRGGSGTANDIQQIWNWIENLFNGGGYDPGNEDGWPEDIPPGDFSYPGPGPDNPDNPTEFDLDLP